jgi:hypothetical protein
MVTFTCQCDWTSGCSDSWSNILDVFLDEIDI